MGNYLCGEYVILNAEVPKNNRNDNSDVSASQSRDALVSDGGTGASGGGGGDAHLSLLEISRRIQRLMLRIQGDFMTALPSNFGTLVDYEALKASDAFAEYLKTVHLLRDASLSSLAEDENERRAFFLNVYNALNVHGIIARGGQLPDTLTGKVGYWKRTGYLIDGMRFTLDDIEHGILRGNSRAASQFWGNYYFSTGDPRLEYSLPKDARVHFALNCGARSCPAIRVYDGQNLEKGLLGATKAFCSSEVQVVEMGESAVEVRLSHLFKWFRGDFVPDAEKVDDGKTTTMNGVDPVLRWIVQATGGSGEPVASVEKLRTALESGKTVSITYKPYDWTSNKR